MGLLRHPGLWTEQLTDIWPFHWETVIYGHPQTTPWPVRALGTRVAQKPIHINKFKTNLAKEMTQYVRMLAAKPYDLSSTMLGRES